jgi:hypothetical protein
MPTSVRKHLICELQLKEYIYSKCSTRFSARIDTSHYGPPRTFKDVGVVADSLTGIHIVMVKCLLVVSKSCVHEGV